MSTPATDPLPSTVSGELTTALIPTVTKIDTRLDVSPISVVLAVSIVCILSPITVTGNSIILAAFYRYKRLRTASNYLLVSLAVSDFGVSFQSIFPRDNIGDVLNYVSYLSYFSGENDKRGKNIYMYKNICTRLLVRKYLWYNARSEVLLESMTKEISKWCPLFLEIDGLTGYFN